MTFTYVTTLVLVCIVIECFLTYWIPRLRKDFQWLIIALDEKPLLPQDGLKKFISHGYDPELGWTRKPNTSASESGGTAGEDTMNYKKSSYSINNKGARFNPEHEELPILISTYGDSFVFCRQVNDNQTFQHYLSKLTNSNVLNFGVGNYGFDQSLLRFKREFPKNRSKIVIIGVVPETITRILSVWKHYYEYGNVLGFKPRYFLRNNQLKLEANPMQSPEDFHNITKHINSIKRNDFFYKYKFKRDILRSPYIFSLLKNPSRNIPLLAALTLRSFKGLDKINVLNFKNKPWELILKNNSNIVKALYKESSATDLFLALIEDFVESADNFGCMPVLLLMPYLHDVYYSKQHGSFYENFKSLAQNKVKVIDLMDHLIYSENLNSYYHTDFYGGHMSAEGNKWVAELLYKELNNDK